MFVSVSVGRVCKRVCYTTLQMKTRRRTGLPGRDIPPSGHVCGRWVIAPRLLCRRVASAGGARQVYIHQTPIFVLFFVSSFVLPFVAPGYHFTFCKVHHPLLPLLVGRYRCTCPTFWSFAGVSLMYVKLYQF